MHFIWNAMNFFSIQFNPVRRVILRNITFVFDEFWKRMIISFLFIQTRSHMTNVFSLHDYHTSNQKPFPTTMTLLSTSSFQHLFIFQQFESLNTFTFDPIIAILKSRQSISSSFHPTTMTVLSTFHHKDSFKWIDYHFQSVVFNLNIFREWGRENWERERNKLNNNMISSWIIFISTWWKLWISSLSSSSSQSDR